MPVDAPHDQPPDASPASRLLTGWAAFVGTFLFIPLWDLYALFVTIRQARAAAGNRILSRLLGRIVVLAAAFALAISGIGGLARVIGQPGPFGFVATGLSHLSPPAPAAPLTQPIGALIAARLPTTLALLATASILAGLLAIALIGLWRLADRQPRFTPVLHALADSLPGVLVIPAGSAAVVGTILFGIRFKLFPVGSALADASMLRQAWGLVLPGAILALLPGLLAARAAIGAMRERPAGDPVRWALAGTAAARAYMDQAGWLLSGLVVVEGVFGLKGIGGLLLMAISRGDLAVVAGVIGVMAIMLLVARLRATIDEAAYEAAALAAPPVDVEAAGSALPRRTMAIKLALAGLVLLLPLIAIVRGIVALPYNPYQTDIMAIYSARSAEHPLGTDHLGRDVQSRVMVAQRNTWAIALSAGVIALAFGSAWAAAAQGAGALFAQRSDLGAVLAAGVVRLPAEAAVLLHPALVVLAFSIARFSASGQALMGAGVAVGLALTPRIALSLDDLRLFDVGPRQWSRTALAALPGIVFVALTYSLAVGTLGLGLPEPAVTLGGLLAQHQELIAAASFIRDSRYLWLAINTTVPGLLAALGVFLLFDAISTGLHAEPGTFLPRLFR